MDAERGELYRMDYHQFRPSLQCTGEVLATRDRSGVAEIDRGSNRWHHHDMGRGRAGVRSRRAPKTSTTTGHAHDPGRDPQVMGAGRPLEEMQLEHAVASYLPPGKSLRLRLTENCYAIISVRRGSDGYCVRAHRMFAGATPRLARALARYVVHNDQRASNLLGEFIERNSHQIRSRPRRERRVVLRTHGQHHDLSSIYDRLNLAYFGGTHDARIAWGSARRLANRRSLKAGSYSVEDRLIRIHPALDQKGVPGFFVDWVVFHEMLHGKHAIRKVRGRRYFHPPEFAQEERRFAEYRRARVWEKTHMDRLLGG